MSVLATILLTAIFLLAGFFGVWVGIILWLAVQVLREQYHRRYP